MLGIVRKDVLYFVVSACVLMPVLLLVERLVADVLRTLFVMVNSILLYVFLIGPMMIAEQTEEKCNGYAFLGSLPVTRWEIVTGKFCLVLMSVAILVAGNLVLLASWPGPPDQVAISQSAVILNGALCLLICGVIYTGVFSLGYTRSFVVGTVSVGILSLVPPVLTHKHAWTSQTLIPRFADLLLHTNPLIFVAAGLAGYALLMLLATRLFSFEPKQKNFHWF